MIQEDSGTVSSRIAGAVTSANAAARRNSARRGARSKRWAAAGDSLEQCYQCICVRLLRFNSAKLPDACVVDSFVRACKEVCGNLKGEFASDFIPAWRRSRWSRSRCSIRRILEQDPNGAVGVCGRFGEYERSQGGDAVVMANAAVIKPRVVFLQRRQCCTASHVQR